MHMKYNTRLDGLIWLQPHQLQPRCYTYVYNAFYILWGTQGYYEIFYLHSNVL